MSSILGLATHSLYLIIFLLTVPCTDTGTHLGKIGIRNGFFFLISLARPRPKSGHVLPSLGSRLPFSKIL